METEINYTTTQTQRQPPQPSVAKKKRSLLRIIKIALFMLKNKTTMPVSSKSSLWRRIVGAMRNLHSHQQSLEHHPSSSPPPVVPKPISNVNIPTTQTVVDPPAPVSSHIAPMDSLSSSSSWANMSQFASAQNLQELDRSCKDEDVGDGMNVADEDGDVMIDARAEEYIAHFYDEMKLQRIKSVNRHKKRNEAPVLQAKDTREAKQ